MSCEAVVCNDTGGGGIQEVYRRGEDRDREDGGADLCGCKEAGVQAMTEEVKVVGRAEHKFTGAMKFFKLNLRDKLVLDIGSSTGGFTEASLRMGARKVIAVEKGTRQMKAPLRFDPRIDLHEKTDIFDFELAYADRPDVIVADVSFVSLVKVLKYAKRHLARKDTEFLVMLKPQFEARPWQLQNGILKNNKIRREIIVNFEAALKQNGFYIAAKKDNDLAGRFGNVERFYYLRLAKA